MFRASLFGDILGSFRRPGTQWLSRQCPGFKRMPDADEWNTESFPWEVRPWLNPVMWRPLLGVRLAGEGAWGPGGEGTDHHILGSRAGKGRHGKQFSDSAVEWFLVEGKCWWGPDIGTRGYPGRRSGPWEALGLREKKTGCQPSRSGCSPARKWQETETLQTSSF